jgi:hypothetical protein
MRTLIVLLSLGCACKQASTAPAAPDAPTAPVVAAPAAPTALAAPAAPTADAAPVPPPQQRPGGPTLDACRRAADHLATLVVDSAIGATNDERAYVERMQARGRGLAVALCMEVAVPQEAECMQRAKDFGSLAACERFRREVPKDLLAHTEPTQADCERFFDRLRQFRIEDGDDPHAIDATRDQVVRSCQEKAKIGTLACFIASPTYRQARSCP